MRKHTHTHTYIYIYIYLHLIITFFCVYLYHQHDYYSFVISRQSNPIHIRVETTMYCRSGRLPFLKDPHTLPNADK